MTRSRRPKLTMVCYQCHTIETGLHPLVACSFFGQHWDHPTQVAEFNETTIRQTLAWASTVVVAAERHLLRYQAAL